MIHYARHILGAAVLLTAAGALSSLSTGCTSCGSDPLAGDSIAATIDPRFREVYALGADHGIGFGHLAVDSAAAPDRLCDRLLEVRARANDISSRFTPDAGQAYILGFQTGVRRTAPAIADSIF